MSLQSYVGDITHNIGTTVNDLLNQAQNGLKQINGSVQTALSTIWSGGFAGISESGLQNVERAIDTYIASIQQIINEFKPEGDIEIALKGAPHDAAVNFIASVKQLLDAYVSTMRNEKNEMWEAYNNYKKAGQNISQQVTQDADAIRQNADSIKVD